MRRRQAALAQTFPALAGADDDNIAQIVEDTIAAERNRWRQKLHQHNQRLEASVSRQCRWIRHKTDLDEEKRRKVELGPGLQCEPGRRILQEEEKCRQIWDRPHPSPYTRRDALELMLRRQTEALTASGLDYIWPVPPSERIFKFERGGGLVTSPGNQGNMPPGPEPEPGDSGSSAPRPGVRTDPAAAWRDASTYISERTDIERIRLSGPEIKKSLRKARNRAPGHDGWRAEHLEALPDTWFDKLAQLWTMCLHRGKVPISWTRSIVTLIPKPDGDKRPITITGILWRAMGRAVIHRLTDWIDSWIPDDMCGSLLARGCYHIHARIADAIEDAKMPGRGIALISEDLSKAFDRAEPDQALLVMAAHGFPQELCHIIRFFYASCTKVFTMEKVYSANKIRSRHGLLQGCAWSPLLLAAAQVPWYNKVRSADIHVGMYADDRVY